MWMLMQNIAVSIWQIFWPFFLQTACLKWWLLETILHSPVSLKCLHVLAPCGTASVTMNPHLAFCFNSILLYTFTPSGCFFKFYLFIPIVLCNKREKYPTILWHHTHYHQQKTKVCLCFLEISPENSGTEETVSSKEEHPVLKQWKFH